uniref:Mitochondrial inner membrane protein Mpv17 n=1 Tax=Crassostrea virginica TaxID=6565 RepID=A0A8B8AFS5_CRAVI|nr:protein sym-1-like isoform X1 [Crassostrea virginica]
MARLLQSYLRILEKHPLVTMSCTTGTLMATGDAISQLVVERTKKFDFVRNGRFLVFGVFIGGPMFRGWYFSIDKVFGKTKYAPMKMMIADQGVFAPVFLPFFLFTMGIMRQDPVHEIKNKIKKDYYDVITTNWKIWPAAQIINFTFVPLQHRIMVVNIVSIGWNCYMAWISEKEHEDVVYHHLHPDQETEQTVRSQTKLPTPHRSAATCSKKDL